MSAIRIVDVPPGEAPEHIRRAWVGLIIPLPHGRSAKRRTILGHGVLTGPKSLLGNVWALLTRRYVKWDAYTVDASAAVDALARSQPDAAQWWRENTPYLLKPGKKLAFPADVCELQE